MATAILGIAILTGIAIIIWRTNDMSALSDAVATIEANQQKIQTDVKAVLALLTQPSPDVAAAVTKLQAIAGEQVGTESELEGALPPAPPA